MIDVRPLFLLHRVSFPGPFESKVQAFIFSLPPEYLACVLLREQGARLRSTSRTCYVAMTPLTSASSVPIRPVVLVTEPFLALVFLPEPAEDHTLHLVVTFP